MYFYCMNADATETIRLKSAVVQIAKYHKEKTGIPIKVFIERAIIEKDKRLKSKKKQ